MQSLLPFTKMHGLGNDFVMINVNHTEQIQNLEAFSKSIAERRLGIGCDQVIFFTKVKPNYYKMQIYNADGSFAKACGNATRCLALLIKEKTEQEFITIEAASRKLFCSVNTQSIVSVNMGPASFNETWMPPQDKIWNLLNTYRLNTSKALCVDVGNPHLVIFCDNLSESEFEFLGKKFSTHELFPNGVNVNFVNVIKSELHLTVWERGVGVSLACGSGACASFAAACKLGFIQDDESLVYLKLGSLKMKLKDNDIIMSGTATKVAVGKYLMQI
jgi:diaminopimelate epimerase